MIPYWYKKEETYVSLEREEERGKDRGKEREGRREPCSLLLCFGCREIMPDERVCEEVDGSDLPKP